MDAITDTHTLSTTSYAQLSRRQARAALVVIVLTALGGVGVTLSPLASNNFNANPGKPSDVDLYRAEVERIHRGEGYYEAARAELTARGYPTRSVFNWRTPLPMWLVGKLPAVVLGKAILGGLALAMLLLTFETLARENEAQLGTAVGGYRVWLRPMGCALLMTGAALPAFLRDFYVVPVLWAGILIALSVCMYGIGRPRIGLAFGLAAIFFRELALPYGVLCAAIAWRRGRRGELAAWLIGLATWFAFFGLHWWYVHEWMAAGARAHREGWIQFGGIGFVISTAQMNAYLLLLPQWVTALYLVAALVGFAGWRTPLGVRVGGAACLFLAAFAVVGQSFNQYWGAMVAPLLCFGVARLPVSIRDLWRAAFNR